MDLLWDDTEEIYVTEKYLRNNPEVKWKGCALCDEWEEEIPEPLKRMFTYMERKKVQKEYLDSITLEDRILMQWAKRFGTIRFHATNLIWEMYLSSC